MTKRLKPNDRKRQLVERALHVAERDGLAGVTYQAVAYESSVTIQTVQKYYPTKCQLMRDLMRVAIRTECLPVIAEGLATRCAHAAKADDVVKRRALAQLGASV